jgi:hypothetical protein
MPEGEHAHGGLAELTGRPARACRELQGLRQVPHLCVEPVPHEPLGLPAAGELGQIVERAQRRVERGIDPILTQPVTSETAAHPVEHADEAEREVAPSQPFVEKAPEGEEELAREQGWSEQRRQYPQRGME